MGNHRFAARLAVIVAALFATDAAAAPGAPLTPMIDLGTTVSPVTTISGPGGEFVTVTSEWVGNGTDVFVRAYDADGQPYAPAFRVNSQPVVEFGSWDVKLDKKGFVLAAWEKFRGAFVARRFDRGGRPLTKELAVVDETAAYRKGGSCGSLSIAGGSGAAFVVAWNCVFAKGAYPNITYSSKLRYRAFSTPKAIGGPVLRLSMDPLPIDGYIDVAPRLVVDQDNFIGALWLREWFYAPAGAQSVMMATFGPGGVPLSSEGSLANINEIAIYNAQIGAGAGGNFYAQWNYSTVEHVLPVAVVTSPAHELQYNDTVRRKLCVDAASRVAQVWRDGAVLRADYYDAASAPRGSQLVITLPTAPGNVSGIDCDADGDLLVTYAKARQVDGQWVYDNRARRYAGVP